MLPDIFLSRLHTLLGEDFSAVMQAYSLSRLGSFRVNPRFSDADIIAEFRDKGIRIVPYHMIAGVYVFDRDQEYAIKGTDAFYQGKIYLQSIASMLPVLALDLAVGASLRVLDVCAAPGSKTTQIASILQGQ